MKLTKSERDVMRVERDKFVARGEPWLKDPISEVGRFWHRWLVLPLGIDASFDAALEELKHTDYGKYLLSLVVAQRLENS